VARKSKNEADKQADVPAANPAEDSVKTTTRPAKKPRVAGAKPKKKKVAPKDKRLKSVAPRQTEERLSPAAEPSDDAIRLRAYFLAERRAKLSLPGDSAHDWIEARRQLLEEAGSL
jgi:hypothetical protein